MSDVIQAPARWVVLAVTAAVGIGGGGHVYRKIVAPATIVINGQVVYSGKAVFSNDRLMLPMESVQNAGVQAWVDKANGVVVLHKDDENAAARIDGKRLIVFLSDLPPNQWQGRSGPWEDSNIGLQIAYSVRMETSPLLDEGTVLLPARMVYGGLGADPRTDVVWDGSHREVRVTLPRHVPTRSSPPREFTAPPFLMQALAGE